jgi:hypothetical protein
MNYVNHIENNRNYILKYLEYISYILLGHVVLSTLKFRNQNTKYYLMHFFANMHIVSLTFPYVVETMIDPVKFINTDIFPSVTTVIFHTYHVLFYNNISIDEKIHHLINVYGTLPLLWYNYNYMCNFALFFLMGLPGGITYILLFLKDIGIVSSLTEKRISKHLNLWIRCPGSIVSITLIYVQMIYNPNKYDNYSRMIGWLSIVGTYWNGIYFTKSITESHIRKLYQNK